MAKKKTAAKKKKTAAKKKPARRAKKPAMEMLIVGSKSKAVIKDNGMNVAGDALEGLNECRLLVPAAGMPACRRERSQDRARPHSSA